MHLQQHVAEFSSVLIGSSLEEKKSFINKIKKSSKISPQLAIDIYKNNTRVARINALKAVYPACKNILGNDIFHAIAKEYVNADDIGSSDLNNYGVTFDRHLSAILKAGRLPEQYYYLPDLARLELLVHVAYYADDDPAFDFELFESSVQKEKQVFFRMSESLSLLAFHNPIYEIWKKNYKAEGSGGSSVQSISKTQHLLIHREENIPLVLIINECEYQMLEAFINNQSLQAVIDTIDCDVDEILPMLIAKRWVAGIK